MSGVYRLELLDGETWRAFELAGEPSGEPRRGFAGMIAAEGFADGEGRALLADVHVEGTPRTWRLFLPDAVADGRFLLGPYYLDTLALDPSTHRFELTLAAAGEVQEHRK